MPEAPVATEGGVQAGYRAPSARWSVADDVRLLLGIHRLWPHLLEDMPVYAELCRRVEESDRVAMEPSQEPNGRVQKLGEQPLEGGLPMLWATLAQEFPDRHYHYLMQRTQRLRLHYHHRIPANFSDSAAAQLLELYQKYGPQYRVINKAMVLDSDGPSLRALIRYYEIRQALIERASQTPHNPPDSPSS
ncbi:hypothetical protein IWQ60_009345 [Tieghemiomyces parasiticus]|uniref:Uncharacterized protein n=1 Tax=Tieghemiomyces parasiticus TaxID=78921 RepID=A0A9W8DK21_9FUNG|nr:hypothetical protein IWQ60_009345 [Tieghemiomyces parasiticus]